MKNIKKIMNEMEQIKYGFLDSKGNNIFDNADVEYRFNKIYYLMSPEELLNKKVGVCWDQVELERKLFKEHNIKNETYFIYIDDKKKLPSHTFLVYYMNNKVYWFEHSWFDKKGIHEYNNLNDLLNDVETKFIKSREKEVPKGLDVQIYRYNKPNYNISCDEFFNYIYTQRKIFNFKIEAATINDLDRIKNYKLKTIFKYAKNLSKEEIIKIENYIRKSIPTLIKDYKNIIYNNKIIGSFLIRQIDEGLLLDEIFIEKEYRNKGIGSSIIKNYVLDSNKNIYLWIYKENINALKLYKNLGFKIKEETDERYYMEYQKIIDYK